MTPTEIKLKQRPRRERIRQAQRVGTVRHLPCRILERICSGAETAQGMGDRANVGVQLETVAAFVGPRRRVLAENAWEKYGDEGITQA